MIKAKYLNRVNKYSEKVHGDHWNETSAGDEFLSSFKTNMYEMNREIENYKKKVNDKNNSIIRSINKNL